MATLNLIQRRRRDGSMLLIGKTPLESDPPTFPECFDFGFAMIGEGVYPASVNGDTIEVKYANASATYKVAGPLRVPEHRGDGYTERPEAGFHAHLVPESVTFFDAPPVDEAKVAELEAAAPAADEASDQEGTSYAFKGTPTVNDEPVEDEV